MDGAMWRDCLFYTTTMLLADVTNPNLMEVWIDRKKRMMELKIKEHNVPAFKNTRPT